MSINSKFDRKVDIRSRSSDRRIFWCAVAVAVAAHAVFWSLFTRRPPARRNGENGAAVTMLSSQDFRTARQRKAFRNWMADHDPRNFGSSVVVAEVTEGTLRDVLPPNLIDRPAAAIPAAAGGIEAFREVPGRELSPRPLVPPPPRDIPEPRVRASGSVVDGAGNPLPLGGVKLPPRTPRTRGRTVLRVFRGGGPPALFVDHSCGDAGLDGFAAHSLSFLALRKPAPEFIVVEWSEEHK